MKAAVLPLLLQPQLLLAASINHDVEEMFGRSHAFISVVSKPSD
jgi:hypothetical protein